jgi:CMP-N-acetylneuraminic acid synthetase
MDELSMIAFIPARGGSVGVPRKNIRPLHGVPLVLHSLKFADESKYFSRTILSTDDREIASVASSGRISQEEFDSLSEDSYISLGAKLFIHKRRSSQAQTLSPIREVLFDFVEQKEFDFDTDFIMMLQPTSPFRSQDEMDQIGAIIQDNPHFTSIVSVNSVGGQHPDRMYRLADGELKPLVHQNNQDNKPRQLLEDLYIKDGAYYLLRVSTLRNKTLLGDRMLPLIRSGLCTVNIDSETDFKIAELIDKPYDS